MVKEIKINARYTAIETLFLLKKTRQPVKPLFQKLAEQHGLTSKDTNLAMNLVYGVLRQRSYLNLLLKKLCRQPLNKLKPKVYQGLSVGLYQIFFLDRIPDSAAVNESVNALKKMKVPIRLTGFVNGVLRSSIRQKESLPAPTLPKSAKDPLNHPDWLIKRWSKNFGKEQMVQICRNNSLEPYLSLRVNKSRVSVEGLLSQFQEHKIEAMVGSYAPDCILIKEKGVSLKQLPGFEEGYFQVQDQAAQIASMLLAPFTQETTCLDGCAGLGGKTTHLAELVFEKTTLQTILPQITAIEPEPYRFEKLLETIAKHPFKKHFNCINSSLSQFLDTTDQQFDRVLIDAPCSGTGVTGRHPDIRWNRTEDQLPQYQKTQLELLSQAALLVNDNGVLVYSTCSIEPEENYQVIELFLQDNPDFCLSQLEDFLPQQALPHIQNDCFSPLPSDEIDGFFAARLIKNRH